MESIPIADLGEAHAAMRLGDPQSVRAMRTSLERYGQLTPVVTYAPDPHEPMQIVDGFKRTRAAREIGWPQLAVHVLPCGRTEAMASMMALNDRSGLTELEEAWLCRALCREQHLAQHQVAQLVGRHKSWVCRRLMLVEGLEDKVQLDVRLGLLAPRAAVELCPLPRGNQLAAAALSMRRGMTVAQTASMVRHVLAMPTPALRTQWLADALAQPEVVLPPTRPTQRDKSPAEWLLADIESATRVAARLQARLRERPIDSFDPRVATLLSDAVGALRPVLARLLTALDYVGAGKDLRDAAME
jgi:ParB-like chromosome segregation protein Spo0J